MRASHLLPRTELRTPLFGLLVVLLVQALIGVSANNFDYELQISPILPKVLRGETVSFSVTVLLTSSSTQDVTLTVASKPPGTTATLNNVFQGKPTFTSTLIVTTGPSTPVGMNSVVIVATGPVSKQASAVFILEEVVAPAPPQPVPVTLTIEATPKLVNVPFIVDGTEFRTGSDGKATVQLLSGSHTVKAPTVSNFLFSSWSGVASSTSNPLTINLDSNGVLKANYSASTAVPGFTLPSILAGLAMALLILPIFRRTRLERDT